MESRRESRRRRCVRPQSWSLRSSGCRSRNLEVFGRSRCRSRLVRLTLGVAGHEIAVRPDNAPGTTSRWRACRCATASGAPMPIRAPWTWLGETPHFGIPQSAPGRMGPDSPSSPPLRGLSQPAVPCGKANSQPGRERRRLPVHRRRTARRPAGCRVRAPLPRSGARHPSGTDCWSASDPRERGGWCASQPGPEPVPGPRTGGSLASRPERPVCHGRPGREAARRYRAVASSSGPVRTTKAPKCASDPHVVSALRYGSKSERVLPPDPTPASGASCTPMPP